MCITGVFVVLNIVFLIIKFIAYIINNIMNKEILDKVVSLHTEIDNVGKKIEAIKFAESTLLLEGIDIDKDAISFIREKYEANLAFCGQSGEQKFSFSPHTLISTIIFITLAPICNNVTDVQHY